MKFTKIQVQECLRDLGLRVWNGGLQPWKLNVGDKVAVTVYSDCVLVYPDRTTFNTVITIEDIFDLQDWMIENLNVY